MANLPVANVPGNTTSPAGTTATSDAGQGVVNDIVKNCPWIPSDPSIPITQGYGVTTYTGEPSGHGHPHWHAGVDLGVGTGTVVEFPTLNSNPIVSWIESAFGGVLNVTGSTIPYGVYHRGIWNGSSYAIDPDGYGSHPVTITLDVDQQGHGIDVILGHGMAWLQAEGANITSGDQLVKTDCEGNCSGPHLHFEVRPIKGAYGSDVDPWTVLSNGEASTISNPVANVGADVQAAAQDISGAITTAVTDAEKLAIGGATATLGALIMSAGGWLMFKGVQATAPVRTVTSAVRPVTRTFRSTGGTAKRVRLTSRPAGGSAAPRVPRQPAAPPIRQPSARPATPPSPAPSSGGGAGIGASAVAKVRAGANPSTLTQAEGAWLKAHPDQLVAALRAAGGRAA